MIPEDDVLGQANRNTRVVLIVAGAVLLLAVVLSLLTSAQVARPLEALGATPRPSPDWNSIRGRSVTPTCGRSIAWPVPPKT